MKYVVTGPHRVHEVSPGGSVDLDPKNPETVRLLSRGQIARRSKSTTHDAPAGPVDTEE